jgi:hypothetical protein
MNDRSYFGSALGNCCFCSFLLEWLLYSHGKRRIGIMLLLFAQCMFYKRYCYQPARTTRSIQCSRRVEAGELDCFVFAHIDKSLFFAHTLFFRKKQVLENLAIM